jgi:orotate phosphoribosyltransferase
MSDSADAVRVPERTAFLEMVSARRGHFRLESGHHGGLWLDLDALFAEPARIDPFAARLADAIRPHAPDVICGPLLGGAFLAQLVARELGAEFCFTERVTVTRKGGLFGARYRLPPAFAPRVRGRRVAMVDDVMSAGSALRGTHAELQAHGAETVAAGALLVLGAAGADFFAERGIAVLAVARDHYPLWAPADCPFCAAGVALEDVAVAGGDPAHVARIPARDGDPVSSISSFPQS